MSAPDRTSISGMADLMAAMNNMSAEALSTPLPPLPPVNPSGYRPGMVDPATGQKIEVFDAAVMEDVAMGQAMPMPTRVPITTEDSNAMAKILRAYVDSGAAGDKISSGLDHVSEELYEDSEYNTDLKRALTTSVTKNGVRIGGWEIVSDKARSRYHVVSAESRQQIAKDLYLYEAATALVNLLNDGAMINNYKVQAILSMEMEYSKNIEDAIIHKHAVGRALDRGEDTKLELSKVRFNEAKAKAIAAKRKLMEHIKKI
jgi:hypothetical protein